MYDIIIIGAGPAGISAGIYAVSRGKKTLILEKNKVGGADGAVKEALYLAQFASVVTIICVEKTLACIAEFKNKVLNTPNIRICAQSHIEAFYGTAQLEGFDLVSDVDGRKETITDPGCGVFTYIGLMPNTQLYAELELENGYIPVDEKMQTAIPGVYAAGDIRVKQIRQAATAVADGAIAAINAAM